MAEHELLLVQRLIVDQIVFEIVVVFVQLVLFALFFIVVVVYELFLNSLELARYLFAILSRFSLYLFGLSFSFVIFVQSVSVRLAQNARVGCAGVGVVQNNIVYLP